MGAEIHQKYVKLGLNVETALKLSKYLSVLNL